MLYPTEERINILAPAVRGGKGSSRKSLQLRQRGFTRVRVDGHLSLDEEIRLDRRRNHTIDVVVDRPCSSRGSSAGLPSRSRSP